MANAMSSVCFSIPNLDLILIRWASTVLFDRALIEATASAEYPNMQ